MKSRVERAAAWRPIVAELLARVSVREAEKITGVSRTALSDFVEKGQVPQDRTLDKLDAWAEREGMDVGGGGYRGEESAEEAMAIDWPQTSYLEPAAEALYLRYLGEFAKYGWMPEIVADAAHELVRHFETENELNKGGAGRPSYSEDQQLMILRTARKRIVPEFGGTGRARRR